LSLWCFSVTGWSIHAIADVDSLKRLLPAKDNVEKAELLYTISGRYKKEYRFEEAIDYALQALSIVEHTNNDLLIADYLNGAGVLYRRIGNNDLAIEYYQKSLLIKQGIKDHKGVVKTLNNLGNVYREKEMYATAADHYTRALDLAREIDDKRSISASLNHIAILHAQSEDYKTSLLYFKQYLSLKEEINDSVGIAKAFNNIGIAYENMGQHHKAIEQFNHSLKLKSLFDDKQGIINTLINIGKSYTSIGDYNTALKYYHKVLKQWEIIKTNTDIAAVHNKIGNLYIELEDYVNAQIHLEKALHIAFRDRDIENKEVAYFYLTKLYEQKGDYKNAFKYLQHHANVLDTILTGINEETVSQIGARYHFEKRERELLYQEEKKLFLTRLVALSVLTIILVLMLYYYSQNRNRKKANSALQIEKDKAQESDRLKSAFLANMSHEIRTPMNAILGFTDLLKDASITLEERTTYLSIIENGGQRMLSIIDDLIDISKIESGLIQLNLSEVSVVEQLQVVYKHLHNDAEIKGIELKLVNEYMDDVVIKTDLEKFHAVLLNLVKNGIKFTTAGYVQMGFTENKEVIEFFVRDTGPGIRQDKLGYIFERFIQDDDHAIEEGTGLGLSISKAYIEILGGSIWVKSCVGKGSTFYFTLPKKE